MNLPAFKAAIKKAWLPALAAFAAIMLGSVVYVQHRILPSAEASVAVRDPLTVNTSESTSAAVPFDAIIESDRLAAMVSRQLGPRAGSVKGALSVDTILPASGIDISPLYVVHAHAKTLSLAEAIVNAAITQGRSLFAQLNSVNPKEANAVVLPELEAAKASLETATKAYYHFVARFGGDRSTEIAALGGEINALTTQVAQARASIPGATTSKAAAVTDAEVTSLQAQLNSAERRLGSMEPVQARYEKFDTALIDAQDNVQQLSELEQQTLASTTLPIAEEVKVLENATPASNGLLKFLVHALGMIIGLLAAVSIVYLEAARQRSRLTPKELIAMLEIPALGRIPRNALARETR